MKVVFLFVSNFVYSSDLLRTEYIKYLSSKYKVVVFMPPEAFCEDNKPYFKSDNITYVSSKLKFPKFWNLFGKFLRYSMIRKYDFEPVVIRNRENGMKDWRRKVLRIFSYILPEPFWTNSFFTKLEVFFLPYSKEFDTLVKKYNPSLVLTATPGFNHFDAEALILAKKSGLKTAAINFSWDNLHNGGVHFRNPDYLIVWNEIIKKTAVKEYGYPEGKVFVSGTMRFDSYNKELAGEVSREDFLKSKNLDPNEKTILITTVTKGNYRDEHLLLGDLLKARDAGKFGSCTNIFVRMHPKEEFKKFESYLNTTIKNVHVEFPGRILSEEIGMAIEMSALDLENLKCSLNYTDVVINYLSTITLEAFIFDKPVVNINYPKKYERGYTFRHYKPISDAKAALFSYGFDELIDQINDSFKNPALKHKERQEIFTDFVKFRDGISFKRNVDFLDKII